PFGQLVRLLFSHSNEARCREATQRELARLRREIERLGLPDVEVLGPAPAFWRRGRGRHRWQLLLRGADLRPLIDEVELPGEARRTAAVGRAPVFGWSVDVDPVSLL